MANTRKSASIKKAISVNSAKTETFEDLNKKRKDLRALFENCVGNNNWEDWFESEIFVGSNSK